MDLGLQRQAVRGVACGCTVYIEYSIFNLTLNFLTDHASARRKRACALDLRPV